MLFDFFERRVPPYPPNDPALPPKGFFAFLWACTQGMRGWIGLLTLTSALLSVYEAFLFAVMSRVVDWLSSTRKNRLSIVTPLVSSTGALLSSTAPLVTRMSEISPS